MRISEPNVEELRAKKDVEKLVGVLLSHSEERPIWKEAFEALNEIGGKAAVDTLIQSLKDKDWQNRMRAAKALGKMGDKRPVEPLIEALKDGDWRVRLSALRSLGEIGDVRAVESIRQMGPYICDVPDGFVDPNEDLRRAAQETLRKIEAKKSEN